MSKPIGIALQVETVISMIKRRQGSHVRGINYWSQCRDLRLKVLTHNVMILLRIEVFYRAVLPPFLCYVNKPAKLTPENFDYAVENYFAVM
jgi:hypothetical protein